MNFNNRASWRYQQPFYDPPNQHYLQDEYIDEVSSSARIMMPIIVPQTHKGGEPTYQIIRETRGSCQNEYGY